jgi:hypothetical protein
MPAAAQKPAISRHKEKERDREGERKRKRERERERERDSPFSPFPRIHREIGENLECGEEKIGRKKLCCATMCFKSIKYQQKQKKDSYQF